MGHYLGPLPSDPDPLVREAEMLIHTWRHGPYTRITVFAPPAEENHHDRQSAQLMLVMPPREGTFEVPDDD